MSILKLDFYYGSESEQFTFYRLPKVLITDERFKKVSNSAKLLYGLMLDRMSLSVKNGWFDAENRVYIKYAVPNIMQDLNCSKPTAIGMLKELQDIGLIDIYQQNGLANTIYVKNFVSEASSINNNDQSKNFTSKSTKLVKNINQSNDFTSTGKESCPVPVKKIDPNNTKKNNTDLNDTNPINQSDNVEQKIDTMDNINQDALTYMDIIKENIDYDIVMSDKNWPDKNIYDELFSLICDVVCVPRKYVRIGGDNYPYNLVKSKFLKLNSDHLQYVISCFRKSTTKISNIKSYLITALYNAPNTIEHYYTSEVNHDLAW